ncbi:thiamine-phosphate kinase [Desulfurococcus amylolyticus]|uniref:thiamine-phosphate kinase n=1 Tax=Desulfurococcus amylolyticus TaxID=94694 RepID=UPI000A042EC2|nr:thiamine-phosphate kinase [Desulfurococcus amylolyticus]
MASLRGSLGEMGEEAVINLIADKLISKPESGESLTYPDDARDLLPRGPRLIYSMDAYRIKSLMLPWRTWSDIGWMALTGALSDVVVKGGVPSVAMIGLGLSSETDILDLEELVKGLREASNYYDVRITGGDTNESLDPWIAVSVMGFTTCKHPPSRRGARPGDIVIATGSYGSMGFVALHGVVEAGGISWVVDNTKRVYLKLEVANVIMSTYRFIHASMDVSDGLGYTLEQLSELSGYGILLENLPVHPAGLREYCKNSIECMWRHVLVGGEEYGAVLIVAGEYLDKVAEELDYYEIPYSIIGRVGNISPGIYINGARITVERWDQFRGWGKRFPMGDAR